MLNKTGKSSMLFDFRAFFSNLKKMPRSRRFLMLLSCLSLAVGFLTTFAFGTTDTALVNYINIACTIVAAICCLVYVFIFGRFYVGRFLPLLILFNFFTLVSFFLNGCQSIKKSVLEMSLIAVCFYEFALQGGLEKKTAFFSFYLGSLGFLCFFSIVYFPGIIRPSFSNRLGSYFGNANDVARFLGFSAFLFLLYGSVKRWYISFLFGVQSFYYLLLTGSVSNTLVAALCLVLFLFLRFPPKKRWILMLAIIILPALFFGILQAPQLIYYKERIYNIINTLFGVGAGEYDNSTSVRWNLFLEGLQIFLQKPIFGSGFGAVMRFAFRHTFAHNNFAEVLADFGIIGFLFEEGLFLTPFLQTRKTQKHSFFTLFIFIEIVYLFLSQFFIVLYYSKMEFFILALAYSVSDGDVSTLRYIERGSFSLQKGNEVAQPCDPFSGDFETFNQAAPRIKDIKKKLNKEFSLSFFFSIISALLGFLFSYLSAHFLESESYGQVQYYISIANIVTIFLTFGADNRIPKIIQFADDKKSEITKYFFLSLSLSVIALPLYFVIAYFALSKLNGNLLLIFLIYFLALCNSFSSILFSYFTGISKYQLKILLSGVIPHLLFLAVFVIHYLTNTLDLFVSNYLYYSIGIFSVSVLPFAVRLISVNKIRFTKTEFVSLLIFMLILVTYNAQNELSKIIIGERYEGFGVVGIFSVSNQVLSIANLAGGIITNISLPVFAKLSKEENFNGLFRYFQTVSRINISLGIPFFVAFLVEAHSVLSFFGDSYTGFDLILVLLSAEAFINCFLGPCGSVLAMSGGEQKIFISAIVKFASYITVLFIFLNITVYAACIATVVSALLANGVKYFFLCKKYHHSFFTKDILIPLLVVSAVSAICFWPLSFIADRYVWALANCFVGLCLIFAFLFFSPYKQDRIFFKGSKFDVISRQ